MARPLRLEFPHAFYHVINRGNYRRFLFTGKGAAEAFVRALGEAAERFGWKIHAYVVMGNHFHIAVELTEPNLSKGMQWLQGTWIRRYNTLRRLVGRPFQDRYKALLTEPGEHFLRACDYIHLNPCRAGLVPLDHAGDYAWSSLAVFKKAASRPAWLVPTTVLSSAGGLQDSAEGWASYEQLLAARTETDKDKRELHRSKLSRGWCVGSDAFKSLMSAKAKEKGMDLRAERFRGIEPEVYQEQRELQWEDTLRTFAHGNEIDLEKLGPKKSDSHKALLAALMKQTTSVSNAWLARRLKMGAPASASQFARRYRSNPENEAKIQAILSNVKP